MICGRKCERQGRGGKRYVQLVLYLSFICADKFVSFFGGWGWGWEDTLNTSLVLRLIHLTHNMCFKLVRGVLSVVE